MYDDLALAPDPDFDVALRRQLEARLQDRRSRATPGVIDIEFDVDMPLSAGPEPSRQAEHGRSRRAVFAIAAAIVASVAAGLIVDDLVVDDSIDPPGADGANARRLRRRRSQFRRRVAARQRPPSHRSRRTTSRRSRRSCGTPTWTSPATRTRAPAAPPDSTEPPPSSCRPAEQFAASVFESEQRPAATNDREFVNATSNSLRRAPVRGRTPNGGAGGGDARRDAGPGVSRRMRPRVPGVGADRVLRRISTTGPRSSTVTNSKRRRSTSTPTTCGHADGRWDRGTVSRASQQTDQQDMVSAAVRVGRIVTMIDVALTDYGRHAACDRSTTSSESCNAWPHVPLRRKPLVDERDDFFDEPGQLLVGLLVAVAEEVREDREVLDTEQVAVELDALGHLLG